MGTTGSASDGVTVSGTTYTTPAYVAKFIWRGGDGSNFSASTNPTFEAVTERINEAEDEIDEKTHHAWRAVRVTDEYYDIEPRYWGKRQTRTGYYYEIPLYLRHKDIRTFVSGTHKIEIWDGSSWTELVANYTEGRDEDYWVDYTRGIIYFCDQRPYRRKSGVRVTYDYGKSTVSKDIRKLCNLLVAIDLAYSDDASVLFPEGGSSISLERKIDKWEVEAEKLISTLREHKIG